MAEWIYLMHPPRDDFAATMTDAERATFAEHRDYLERLHDAGALILAGPTLGTINTGVTIFEAADEDAATAIMEADPAIAGGIMRGDLRPFRATFLRGRA